MASSGFSSENPRRKDLNKPEPNCVLLLPSAFLYSPKTPAAFKPNLIVRELRSCIASATDNFLKLLNSLASRNPVLGNLLSLPSAFQKACHDIRGRDFRYRNPLDRHGFAAILPGDSVAEVVVTNGILNFLNIYNTLLVARLVLTWFPSTPAAIVSPLSTLCDPYLNIFRGIIPPLGGTLDLSPILAFLLLNAFTSAAAALPCELPSAAETSGQRASSAAGFTLFNLTESQKKWMQRLRGKSIPSKGL